MHSLFLSVISTVAFLMLFYGGFYIVAIIFQSSDGAVFKLPSVSFILKFAILPFVFNFVYFCIKKGESFDFSKAWKAVIHVLAILFTIISVLGLWIFLGGLIKSGDISGGVAIGFGLMLGLPCLITAIILWIIYMYSSRVRSIEATEVWKVGDDIPK